MASHWKLAAVGKSPADNYGAALPLRGKCRAPADSRPLINTSYLLEELLAKAKASKGG
jgi:hypothetical protein